MKTSARPFRLMAVFVAAGLWAVRLDAQTGAVADENERIIVLEAFRVRAGPFENFGFQTSLVRYGTRHQVTVTAVIPNTAAAKAGLMPGDIVLNSDGTPVDANRRSSDWQGFHVPIYKRPAMERGEEITWTLDVRAHGPKAIARTVVLKLPSAPPRWGAKIWAPPEGRPPADVPEGGPLSARAKLILENGVAIMLREDLAHNLPRRSYYYGYQWSAAEGRTFIVSQVRKRTDIILQSGRTYYLTSPSGVLELAVINEHVPQLDPWREIPLSQAQAAFQREVNFWLNGMGKVSDRWPLEVIPGRR